MLLNLLSTLTANSKRKNGFPRFFFIDQYKMPFVPSSQRLKTTDTQIQVTEPINPPQPQPQQTSNEETEMNNSQNNNENENNNNTNDLEDLLLTVLDELDVVKGLLLEQGITSQEKNKPLPVVLSSETLINKSVKDLPPLPPPPQQAIPKRNAQDFSNCF
jgi:hypothetical protein